MELDKNWTWCKRKLGCRIRQETGNPSGDDLRERFAELAGVDLREVLSEMKNTKKKKEQTNKLAVDVESDKVFKALLSRSHILGATNDALVSMKEYDEVHAASFTQRNLHKQYTLLPKSPPKRILLEIQRERARPLKLPDQEENSEAAAKLQKKLAKQRAARMAAMDRNSKDDTMLNGKDTVNEINRHLMSSVLPKYNGDMFGSGGPYLESMLYLSRMANATEKSTRCKSSSGERESSPSKTTNALNDNNKGKSDEEGMRPENEEHLGLSEQSNATDLGSKLYCAAALCNWSRNSSNAHRLAGEGAVRAIMQLFLEPTEQIVKFCASAFRFMSEHTPLALSMIDEGAIATISDSINSNSDEFILSNLAVALVNLTRINHKEANIVEAGIVLALMNLILVRPELSGACARGLYNLTCVDVTYPFIERVIKALVSLSSSGTSNVKHICAAALCNLSDLKSVRPRLVEEGTIAVLSTLSRGSETRTRRVCAVILQNLSASKTSRVDMVSRNSVTVAYSLSSDQDPIILRAIGLTLSRLALEPVNSSRIIYESGITALCNIGVKYPTVPGISQPVAMAFQLLSSRSAARINIVQEGSVTAIAALLRLSSDLLTLQHSLLALCNLLIEPDSHLSIVQQGLIITLINLCSHENDAIRDLCSLALFNFSSADDSRKHIINSGAITAITTLANHKNVMTKRRCAAALCNCTSFEQGMSRMVQDGIIPCLVSLVLASDIETVHHSCAALCRLSCNVENGRLILESGAIPNLVKGALDSDVTTKQFCGAVLSSLSFYDICRGSLIENGILSVLKILSQINDDVTKQRCLVAYANLSCEESVQVKMVNDGVVKIIAELAESYQEVNYICCAKAMCNLACNNEIRERIARDGGVYALLMISMVHSVDKHTKLLCVMALMNLLEDSTVQFMLNEGIVGSIVNLCKIADDRIVYLCAQLFNLLTFYEQARIKISEKHAYMTSLFEMLESDNVETQIIAARTTANLVLCPLVREKAIAAGAINVLERGIQLSNEDASLQCLKAVYSACSEIKFLAPLAKATLPSTLGTIALKSSGLKYSFAVRVLSILAWEKSSRVYLQTSDFSMLLMNIIEKNLQVEDVKWLATTMRYLVHGYKNNFELVDSRFANAIRILHTYGDESNPECLDFVAETLRVLSSSGENCANALGNATVIEILKKVTSYRGSNAETMYHVAITLYNFAQAGTECRMRTALPCVPDMIDVMLGHKQCCEPLAAAICIYLFDTKCRQVFALSQVGAQLINILENSAQSTDTVYNAISAIYAMSKMPKCRDFLSHPPLNVDAYLLKISQTDNQKIKANCSRALKNVSSDSSEALEEGAVAALIAMSLEGKNKNKVGDDAIPVYVMPINIDKAICPDKQTQSVADAIWFCDFVVSFGGAAGKGPDPPGPPLMQSEGSTQYPTLSEDVETSEMEGKTKMAFAKMQVPQDLKSSYLLSDKDFEIKQEEDSLEGSEVLETSLTEADKTHTNNNNILEAGSKMVASEDVTLKHVKDDDSTPLPPRGNQSPMAQPKSRRASGHEGKRDRKDSMHRESKLSESKNDKDSKEVAAQSKSTKSKSKEKDITISEKAAQLGLYN